MNDTPPELPEELQQLVLDCAAGTLPDQHDYRVELVRAETDAWVVQVLPEGSVRGGGAQMIVTRQPLKVVDIAFLQ